jgi:hypothetical protein
MTVLSTIPVHSFPSGHTETDVAYYGFLLYLSFTPPVRQWRYCNFLIPFQIFLYSCITNWIEQRREVSTTVTA